MREREREREAGCARADRRWEGIAVTANLLGILKFLVWVGIDWFAVLECARGWSLAVVSALAWRLEGEGCDWLRAVEDPCALNGTKIRCSLRSLVHANCCAESYDLEVLFGWKF